MTCLVASRSGKHTGNLKDAIGDPYGVADLVDTAPTKTLIG